MIKKLTLRNFQAHKKTELDFVPGINVIVGSSDNGKSSITRAFEWVRTNRPLGTGIIRLGMADSDVCSATVEIADRKLRSTVKRIRGKRQNEYTVGNDAMKAIGSNVPQQVTDTLNLEDLNIQHQLSPHFLILDSPGAIGKAINASCHLEEMDKCVAEGKRRANSLQNELSDAEESVAALNDRMTTEFADLDEIREEVDEATELHEELMKLVMDKDALEPTVAAVVQVRQDKLAIPDLATVREAMGLIRETGLLKRDAGILSNAVSELSDVKAEMATIPNVDGVAAATDIIDELAVLGKKESGLGFIVDELKAIGAQQVTAAQKADEARKVLTAAMDGVACPTCGRVFDDDARKYIMG